LFHNCREFHKTEDLDGQYEQGVDKPVCLRQEKNCIMEDLSEKELDKG